MKVLLLNPPGENLYLRDYYCSQISKADYLPPPIDLLVLSGILSSEHEVSVIDAVATGLKSSDCLAKIVKGDYGAVIFLTSFISWKEDSMFMREVKEKTGSILIGTGDILYFEGENILKNYSFLDAVITDFCSNDILHYLSGKLSSTVGTSYNGDNKIIGSKRKKEELLSYPVPGHELFPIESYRWPFSKKYPLSSLITNYGCPYKCSFCSYEKFPFSLRVVTDVIEEMKKMNSLGIKEVYIKDLTFGAVKEHSMKLCQKMISENINLSWSCFSRVDVIDEELLSYMKNAGCHTVMFGIESSKESSLNRYKKGVTVEKIKNAFALCRKLGISTVATFILGLPGESREDIVNTINFAINIKCDYASFNLAEAPPGSTLRETAIERKWIRPDLLDSQYYGTEVPESDGMTKYDKMELVSLAERRFYLRFSYIFNRFISIKSFYELKNLALQGIGLLKRK